MDFGIRGIDPEPRRGFRSRASRDRALQEFSDAVWQRHEATHARGGPISEWPNRQTFKSNWPVDAFRLIVADWKIAEAQANIHRRLPTLRQRWIYPRTHPKNPIEIIGELDEELLDPPPPVRTDWRAAFATQLATQPQLLLDLSPKQGEGPGDGIELVLERVFAEFPRQRAAIRGWLEHRGTVEPPYGGVIPLIAKDLGERPQTVAIQLKNALYRLRWLGDTAARNTSSSTPQHEPRNVSDNNGHAGRAGAADVSAAVAASRRAERQPRSSRGPRPVSV